MRYRWPEDTQFTQVVLSVEQETCSVCQRRLHVCDHRFHPILSLQGPLQLVCKLAHCPDPDCPATRMPGPPSKSRRPGTAVRSCAARAPRSNAPSSSLSWNAATWPLLSSLAGRCIQ